MQPAVRRGLERCADIQPVHDTGVDEASFLKCHDYVTVVSVQAGQMVLHVEKWTPKFGQPFKCILPTQPVA
jgi:hypothetical protein